MNPMISGSNFGKTINNVYLDAKEFFKFPEIEGDILFQVTYWEFENASVNNQCIATNFAYLEEKHEDRLEEFIYSCLCRNIKPAFSEIIKLKKIPSRWVKGIIRQTKDFKNYFYIGNEYEIQDVLNIFDQRLELDEKIDLKVVSQSLDGKTDDKELYIKLRNSLDFRELRNFKLQFGLYLSEVWNNTMTGNFDPILAVKYIKKKSEEDGKNYNNIFADFQNIVVPIASDTMAEFIKMCYKNNILVDLTIDSLSHAKNIYRKLYSSMFDFKNTDTFLESLEECVYRYGDEFYLTKEYLNWIPGTLYIENDIIVMEFDVNYTDEISEICKQGRSGFQCSRSDDKVVLKIEPSKIKLTQFKFAVIPKSYVFHEGDDIEKLSKIKFY